jgi:cytochrome c oxidase subunit 4
MSASHAAGEAAGHGEHHHHVCTFGQFFSVYVALLFLTAATVGLSSKFTGWELGTINFVIAMLVASLKAGLVMTVFMHLRWDTAINNIAFLSSLLFLSLLFLFTIADFKTRGRTDPVLEQHVPVNIPQVYQNRRKDAGAEDDGSFEGLKPYLQRF